MIAAYGEPDRISVATSGNLMGMSLSNSSPAICRTPSRSRNSWEHGTARLRLNRGMDPVIELDGLEVRFGDRTILKKLKAKLTGRSIGLLGPNGAGKIDADQHAARLSQAVLRHRAHLRHAMSARRRAKCAA